MASNNIARLGVVLGLDMAEFKANIDKAIQENKKFAREIQSDTNRSLTVLNELKNATDDYGKSVGKVTLMEREMAGGRLKFATQDIKDKILAQAAAYDAVVAAAAKQAEIAENAKLVAQQEQLATKQIQELKFATEDYGQSLTKVAQIQREVSSGKFSAFSEENKAKLLEQAAAYDRVAAAAKHEAEVVAAAAQVKQQNQSALTELNNLKNATEDYGKTLTKVQIIEREITSGRLQGAGADVKAQLLAQAAAYDKVAASAHKAAGGLTAWQKQGLMYQTTDFFTQVASGQSVMIAALQQGGQLKDQMGGLGNMFKVLTPLVFSTTGAIVAVGAAIGLGAFAAYQGRKEFDALTNSIILTGNYSKVTVDEFGKMATTIANTSRASIGDAKDILNSMIGSGQFTNKTFDTVSKTIQRFSELSGLSSKEAAAKLIPMLDGTAASAKKLNDQYNFLTLEQYKHIEALERQGRLQESIVYTTGLLNQSMTSTKTELGYIDQALDSGKKMWSSWWNAAMNWGKPETLQDQLQGVQKLINEMGSKPIPVMPGMEKMDTVGKEWERQMQVLLDRKSAIEETMRLASKKKDLNGQKEAINDEAKSGGINARLALDQQLEKAKRDLKYANLLDIANDELKIIYESAHKQEDLYAQYLADIEGKDRVHAGARKSLYLVEMQKEMVEREQKLDDYYQKEKNKDIDAAQAERFARQKIADEEYLKKVEQMNKTSEFYFVAENASKLQKENLQDQIKMVGMTEEQINLAKIENEYEKERLDIQRQYSDNQEAIAGFTAQAQAKRNRALENAKLNQQLKDTKFYDAEKKSADIEKDKLETQISMVGMTEKQVKLAELNYQYEKEIKDIKANYVEDPKVMADMLAKAKLKKEDLAINIQLADQLVNMKEVNDTVWKDMTDALDEFVKTGSLNFSKLAQSIIQDLIKIQLKKQALSLWEMAKGVNGVFGSIMSLFGGGSSTIPLQPGGGYADGGDPPVGKVSMVGERGPELFVPKTAGTIIPNNMLQGNSGQTINYNGPYIASMSAIDTQSGVQFLAKNKQAVWATYQSANRGIPMSR
jgi:phage-related minor tail protein